MTNTEIQELIPETGQDLFLELAGVFLRGRMDADEAAIISHVFQSRGAPFAEILEEKQFSSFMFSLWQTIVRGLQLFKQEDLSGVVINALSGSSVNENLEEDTKLRGQMPFHIFLQKFMEDKAQSSEVDLQVLVPQDEVFQHLLNTKNYYLITVLALNVLNEDFFSNYRDIVRTKISMAPYTLGFWEYLESMWETEDIYEVVWADLLSKVISIQPSGPRFQHIMKHHFNEADLD